MQAQGLSLAQRGPGVPLPVRKEPVRGSNLSTNPTRLVRLDLLMERSSGSVEIAIGLIDGPVAIDHPDLAGGRIRLAGTSNAACSISGSIACQHGTFVAGILAARRSSSAPAICPGCTLLVRPIFPEKASTSGDVPSATPRELALAVRESIAAGARVINLSAALFNPDSAGVRQLQGALDFAAARNVITVAAAGNQASIGSSVITRHPWVIPVAGCDQRGNPMSESNFGFSIGQRGLRAPAEDITSLGTDGKSRSFGGTSAAAPFVTGTIALLWSAFPSATATQVKLALLQAGAVRRGSIVPPLLDAQAAYHAMAAIQ
jgi:subtilisin family serine protease